MSNPLQVNGRDRQPFHTSHDILHPICFPYFFSKGLADKVRKCRDCGRWYMARLVYNVGTGKTAIGKRCALWCYDCRANHMDPGGYFRLLPRRKRLGNKL